MSHKQVLIMRKDLNMRKGKMIAQGAHASLGAILGQCTRVNNTLQLALTDPRIEPWINDSFKKICVSVSSEQELLDLESKAVTAGLITCLITDSGLTEFGGIKTLTCLAIGPDLEDSINAITGHLPLL